MLTVEKAIVTIENGSSNVSVALHDRAAVTTKQVRADQLIRLIAESTDTPGVQSGLLPPNCIGLNLSNSLDWTVFLHRPAGYADVTYKTAYSHFPLPDLIFRFQFRLGERVRSAAVVVTGSGPLQADSPLYWYPFSNLYRNNTFCLGNNLLPRCKQMAQLPQVMEFVLSLPNNDDFFLRENNRKRLPQDELYAYLDGKEPEIYGKEILVPRKGSLRDFLSEEELPNGRAAAL